MDPHGGWGKESVTKPAVLTGAQLFRASDLGEESPRNNPTHPLTLLDMLRLFPTPPDSDPKEFRDKECAGLVSSPSSV